MSAAPEASADEGAEASGRRWAFATAEFDERSQELRVNGQLVKLEPKFLEVLRHLLRHAGEIVTKNELLETVWPGRFVSDNSLPKAVSRIREVLGDEDQSVIKTVHGYGYRLVSPVKVHASKASPAFTRLDLREGQHPPLRPNWTLVRQLGSGGQGEVWLVRQDKVGEERVFKFALDVAGLAAIKREITLYRLLQETLPGHDEFTRVLDWNLEEAPYYIELEFGAGGNLESWAERMGGLDKIPLPVRLEVIARIADALAAAHSVGVLHKDLKPSNVLVGDEHDGAPRVKLADFGSGGVLDPQRLEALGITRLGFTRSVIAGEAGATATYLAPEVVAGQPVTVQGDIYSLGIMLYQVVVADLKQPLAAGWERRVGDELLCEDIAQVVAGELSRRLSDAGALAARLRTLEQRRALREAERAEEQRRVAEQRDAVERVRQAELAVERLRTRRNWTLTVLSVLIVGVAFSLALYLDARRARDEAAAAAASSQAVADFLSKDMFAVVGTSPLRDLTVKQMLESAATSLTSRENLRPQVAAQIHAAVGGAFWTMEEIELAEQHLGRAQALYQQVDATTSADALLVAAQHIFARGMLTRLPDDLSGYSSLLERGKRDLGAHHPAVARLQNNLAHARFDQGDYSRAAEEFAILVAQTPDDPPNRALLGTSEMMLGELRRRLGDSTGAETMLRQAIDHLNGAPGGEPIASKSRMFLGLVLLEQDRLGEAQHEIDEALRLSAPWAVGGADAHTASMRAVAARLQLRRGDAASAAATLEKVISTISAQGWNQRRDRTAEFRTWLARAYLENGRAALAEDTMRRALAISTTADGPRHPLTQSARLGLAEVQLARAEVAQARATLEEIDDASLRNLGHMVAEQKRLIGLIALASGNRATADKMLREAAGLLKARFGAAHPLVRRADNDLARVTQASEQP
ncbi:MAG TPA: winged helix-turn-helix domain-containing protein [Verrucomicrobiae bacterium]|nr:winged helix-turn-helix domain-containing protein [Verrucomicrobiae bacterium]